MCQNDVRKSVVEKGGLYFVTLFQGVAELRRFVLRRTTEGFVDEFGVKYEKDYLENETAPA